MTPSRRSRRPGSGAVPPSRRAPGSPAGGPSSGPLPVRSRPRRRSQVGRLSNGRVRSRAARSVTRWVAGCRQVATPLAGAVLAAGAACWVAGWWLGWRELMVAAGACLLLTAGAAGFVVRSVGVSSEVRLEPGRVRAGEPSAGSLRVTIRTGRRVRSLRVELPVGDRAAVFDLPALAPGASTEELFVVATERRGVIQVGPARSTLRDPIGLFEREAASSEARQLIVHPRTVALPAFGSGLLRDLEGLVTADLSVSDLAFHALRDYAPGDERRHVHWRSTAKTGRLLVRQFHDTRRSTLCVVVDGAGASYADPDEVETAMEVAGSLVVRACRDGLPSTLSAAGQAASGVVPQVLLDALARAEVVDQAPGLADQVGRAAARGADISFGVLVSGSLQTPAQLQRAASRFAPEVTVVAVRVAPGEPAGLRVGGRAVLVQLTASSELPGLLRAEAVA